MAMDFEIDERGDFITTVSQQHERLQLSWVNSNYSVLRIDFEQGQKYNERKIDGRLCLNFITDRGAKPVKAMFATVSDGDEVRQRIIIRLKTEKGEMRLKRTLGSYLVRQKHEDIMAAEVQAAVESAVLSEVYDILEKPKVIAKPVHTTGPFFCQNMNVYIYDDDELIYVLSL